MIVAPLEMVSPMFICSSNRLESSTSCGSWQHLRLVCMFTGLGSSLVRARDVTFSIEAC